MKLRSWLEIAREDYVKDLQMNKRKRTSLELSSKFLYESQFSTVISSIVTHIDRCNPTNRETQSDRITKYTDKKHQSSLYIPISASPLSPSFKYCELLRDGDDPTENPFPFSFGLGAAGGNRPAPGPTCDVQCGPSPEGDLPGVVLGGSPYPDPGVPGPDGGSAALRYGLCAVLPGVR